MREAKIIPVLDLLGGVVVQAIAGNRSAYQPISSVLTSSTEPTIVAEALAHVVGHRTIYVADLDAIAGRTPHTLNLPGFDVWLDAGFITMPQLIPNIVPILSSEASVGPSCMTSEVIVSVDLRNGELVGWPGTPLEYLGTAYHAGARRFIILDVAVVGTNRGPSTLELCQVVKQTYPDVELISGGGVRGRADVQRFTDNGVSAVLVATALHTGVLP